MVVELIPLFRLGLSAGVVSLTLGFRGVSFIFAMVLVLLVFSVVDDSKDSKPNTRLLVSLLVLVWFVLVSAC